MIFFGKARELNPFRNRSRRLSEMEMCQPVFKNFFLLFQTEAVGKMNDARRFHVAAIGARAQKSFCFCPCGFDTLFFTKKEITVFIFFFGLSLRCISTWSVAERNVQLVGSSSSSVYVTREKRRRL